MRGIANIKGLKSKVSMNAWLPEFSYPFDNISGTSSQKFRGTKGSIGYPFSVFIYTENQNHMDFNSFILLVISFSISYS